METDEYEISLLRELDVCRGHIRAIEQSLAAFEKRHGVKAERAIADGGRGSDVAPAGELAACAAQLESLARWREREGEYQALLRARFPPSR
jgi:hypothetical protein